MIIGLERQQLRMQGKNRRRIVLVLLGLCVVAAGCAVFLNRKSRANVTLKTPVVSVREWSAQIDAANSPALQIVLSAHPDDELQVINALAESDSLYTVIAVATQGENTSLCQANSRALERVEPQYRPNPKPLGKGSKSCAAARINSWNKFWDLTHAATDIPLDSLNEMAEKQADAKRVGAERADAERADAEQADAKRTVPDLKRGWVGANSARLVFDGGDGHLNKEDAMSIAETIDTLRGDLLPDLPIARVIAGAYHNEDATLGAVYTHPDHQVVQEALRELAQQPKTEFEVWLPLPPNASVATQVATKVKAKTEARANSSVRVIERSLVEYDRLMGVTASGRPVGAHQLAYRWLAFGGIRGGWARSREASFDEKQINLWPQRQYFEVLNASGS